MTRSARRAAERQKGGLTFPWKATPPADAGQALERLQAGDLVRAEGICCGVLALRPNDALAHQVLGIVACNRNDFATAVGRFTRVTELEPLDSDGHGNLAGALARLGRTDAAIAVGRRALELAPRNVVTYVNLCKLLLDDGRFAAAIAASHDFLRYAPERVEAWHNLGLALWGAGRVPEAIETIRKAAVLDPTHPGAASNLLMFLQYSGEHSAEESLAAARAWGETVEGSRAARPVAEFPEPAQLRIGYVSGDFYDHPVGRQIEDVIVGHDRSRVEVVLYATSMMEDETTGRLRAAADGWRSLAALDDRAAARQIAEDGVHVLVDLSGHTDGYRLGIFAHRPAPVQATWLGYFASTGLPQMDFILREPVQIPDDEQDLYTERVWALEDCSFGYQAAEGCPEVSSLPARRNGKVTFGCFNNLAKITDETIAAWARVLHRMPDSRMVLDRKGLDDDAGRDRVLATFARHGIPSERLDLSASRGHLNYLARYAEVDVVLDSFPFNGATTTYEALWMGVPVVSRRWRRMVGHFAESILGPCGHADWVADDEAGYVETAVALAGDLNRLCVIRANLREELARSPLCRPGDCARSLEKAFEGMWRAVRGPATSVQPQEIERYQIQAIDAAQRGELDLAERMFRRMTELAPTDVDAFSNLGVTLMQRKKVGEAIPCFERAIALKPDFAAAYGNLGEALTHHGRAAEAVTCFERSIELEPREAGRHLSLAVPLAYTGRFTEAFAAFERGAALDPNRVQSQGAVVYGQLGTAFATYSHFEEAVVCFAESEKLMTRGMGGDPLLGKACYRVGMSLQHEGRVDEAVGWFEKAIDRCPENSLYAGSLAWCLQYGEGFSAEDASAWAKERALSLMPHSPVRRPAPNLRGPRKLRIGYLSPEFREHPVGSVMETLLKIHRRDEFEFILYSNVVHPDTVSTRLRDLADEWRDLSRLDDDAAAELIRQDEIDILLDLVGYTADHRIGVFARGPAPIQAQWLGYYATSGLPQMDYFVVHPNLIRPEEEAYYTERPMRVAGRSFCYEPSRSDVAVPPLPALARGFVTFGSHNYLAKTNPSVIRAWSAVLKAVPSSRMRLNRQAFVSLATRERFLAEFEANGVERSRIDLLSTHSHDEHIVALGEFDVMLDTFPFNGGTSIYEAFWMGLPVVTMAAPRMVGHFGESILEPLGYGEWVARSEEEYAQIAAKLVRDLPRLAEIRAGLRDHLVGSALCDAPAYTREIEDAFRRMWAERTQALAA